jgi:hypothetical protein
MRPRIAAFGRTAQFIFAIAQAANFRLAASKSSFAENAKTHVIERPPVSKSIFSTQNREPIIEFEMGDHIAKSSLLLASNRAIGAVDDCVIG